MCIFYLANFFRVGDIMDKNRAKHKLGVILQQLREQAGLSRDELAKRNKVSPRTIQNWEAGYSTPDLSQFLQFCEVLRVNPIRAINLYFFSEFSKASTVEDRMDELVTLCKHLSPQAVESLLFILMGDHGSDPFAILQLAVADLQCPMRDRYMVAHQTAANYRFAEVQGLLTCPNDVKPAMGVLDVAIKKGYETAMSGGTRYGSAADRSLFLEGDGDV